ncbi:hypothetical protein P175DRAFT_0535844 [Aspergillus ochraceoroseus IBT 24754]|uniref:Uncharacterized protein n=1 Tax=Aspergillus ochraceoroseus IBT 24754 TaxID=1392256 RepID=A0A2T5LMK7_9EURO|nr:uncharacterized protein P175DRAFT_0535844 [Aspergillus ochraceoroseus IBT 24754]PTU17511.1 hypothetical protein P175DRAFT_0535844 [Aspergillus ochraceoroseus IBT 24754]
MWQPFPKFYIVRPDSRPVPLIPLDELPDWLQVGPWDWNDLSCYRGMALVNYYPMCREGEYDIICYHCLATVDSMLNRRISETPSELCTSALVPASEKGDKRYSNLSCLSAKDNLSPLKWSSNQSLQPLEQPPFYTTLQHPFIGMCFVSYLFHGSDNCNDNHSDGDYGLQEFNLSDIDDVDNSDHQMNGQCPRGERGPEGPQGPQGVPGPRGPSGPPGLPWYADPPEGELFEEDGDHEHVNRTPLLRRIELPQPVQDLMGMIRELPGGNNFDHNIAQNLVLQIYAESYIRGLLDRHNNFTYVQNQNQRDPPNQENPQNPANRPATEQEPENQAAGQGPSQANPNPEHNDDLLGPLNPPSEGSGSSGSSGSTVNPNTTQNTQSLPSGNPGGSGSSGDPGISQNTSILEPPQDQQNEGQQGQRNPPNSPGLQGPRGHKGPPGPRGPQGPAGPQGQRGRRGQAPPPGIEPFYLTGFHPRRGDQESTENGNNLFMWTARRRQEEPVAARLTTPVVGASFANPASSHGSRLSNPGGSILRTSFDNSRSSNLLHSSSSSDSSGGVILRAGAESPRSSNPLGSSGSFGPLNSLNSGGSILGASVANPNATGSERAQVAPSSNPAQPSSRRVYPSSAAPVMSGALGVTRSNPENTNPTNTNPTTQRISASGTPTIDPSLLTIRPPGDDDAGPGPPGDIYESGIGTSTTDLNVAQQEYTALEASAVAPAAESSSPGQGSTDILNPGLNPSELGGPGSSDVGFGTGEATLPGEGPDVLDFDGEYTLEQNFRHAIRPPLAISDISDTWMPGTQVPIDQTEVGISMPSTIFDPFTNSLFQAPIWNTQVGGAQVGGAGGAILLQTGQQETFPSEPVLLPPSTSALPPPVPAGLPFSQLVTQPAPVPQQRFPQGIPEQLPRQNLLDQPEVQQRLPLPPSVFPEVQSQPTLQPVMAQDAPTQSFQAEQGPSERAPTQPAMARDAPTQSFQAEQGPSEQAPTQPAMARDAPTQSFQAEQGPSERAPTQPAMARDAPTQSFQAEQGPSERAPTQPAIAPQAPVRDIPRPEPLSLFPPHPSVVAALSRTAGIPDFAEEPPPIQPPPPGQWRHDENKDSWQIIAEIFAQDRESIPAVHFDDQQREQQAGQVQSTPPPVPPPVPQPRHQAQAPQAVQVPRLFQTQQGGQELQEQGFGEIHAEEAPSHEQAAQRRDKGKAPRR